MSENEKWLPMAELAELFGLSEYDMDGVLGAVGVIRATGEPTDYGRRVCARREGDAWVWDAAAVKRLAEEEGLA